jgi:SAM-dependent methyltransferase
MSDDYGPSTYGDRIADAYDDWPGLPDDAAQAAEFLAGVGGSGPVLELGIGTGRVALPLAARGLDVNGIDASKAMVAKMRAKPGGNQIPVIIGDFANIAVLVEGHYSLIYVVFNTFFGLLTQDDQIRCFEGVARHLARKGVFVMRAFVPGVARFDRGQRTEASVVDSARVVLDASRYSALEKTVETQHVVIDDRGVGMYPVKLRFAWPAELDLMARLAGLRLRERWGGWDRQLLTSASRSHISVWERLA